MATITREQNQQILESLGFTGQAGEGRGNDFLRSNPQLIQSYTQARQRIEPEYDAAGLLQTVAPGIPITDLVSSQVQNPRLAPGTEFAPITQTVQENELLQPPTLDPNAQAISTIPQIDVPQPTPVQQAQATTVDPAQATAMLGTATGQIDPALTQAVAPAVAQQTAVDPLSTIQGQLDNLLSPYTETGEVPIWAKGAVAAAQANLARTGMGASSIAGGDIFKAVIESAIPIASQDANVYFQTDIANLNNRQQTELENLRVRQQNMLTDTSIRNATEQFNASSDIQREQFMATLVSNIEQQNASRVTAISQFNSAEINRLAALDTQIEANIETANAQLELTVGQFNATLAHQRETFNAEMQFAVEQSNAQWRRSINTANTATINAGLQTNVQNRFNMSQVAQNNLWQQFRDEASWAFTASENAQNRAYNAAQAANNRQFQSRNDNNWLTAAGQFAASMFL